MGNLPWAPVCRKDMCTYEDVGLRANPSLPNVDTARLIRRHRVSLLALPQPFDDGGVGHAAAFTHRLQPVASAALFERVQQGGHDAGTAGAQRVPDGDGPTVDVGLAQIGSGVVSPCWADRALRLRSPT